MVQTQMQRAAELFGVVDGVLEFIGTTMLPFDQQQYIENIKYLRSEFGREGFY